MIYSTDIHNYRHRLQWMHSGCPVSPSEATKCCTARAAPVRPQMQHFKHRQRRQWGYPSRISIVSQGKDPLEMIGLQEEWTFNLSPFFGTSRDMHVETVFAELPLKSRIASREKSPGKLGENRVKISCDMAVVLPCLARWPMNVSWWQMHQKGAWSLFAKDIQGDNFDTFWRATLADVFNFFESSCPQFVPCAFEAGVRHSSQRPLFLYLTVSIVSQN